ncbi:hypothetical protein [Yersinia sp. 2541 StPb PI]|uniref:hypothetical protein n=1 Tax=Yersinia sp. 2541 StPb PI TaxID=3117407 RepID=UPI003FA4A935
MKKLKFDFRLSHILFFFFGVMVTVVLLWVLYKDPTRITAPALAALTAMCTFLLALWSAFKVNKWLNSKVNDAAFKQTERILESFAEMHVIMDKLKSLCKLLCDINMYSVENLKPTDSIIDNIRELDDEGFKCFITALTLIVTIKPWNANINEGKIIPLIYLIQVNHGKLRIDLVEIQKTFVNKNYHLTVIAAQNCVQLNKELSNTFSKFFNLKYDDIFMFNVKSTSPSKKVSE